MRIADTSRKLPLIGAALAAVVALGACGSSGSAGDDAERQLDTQKVERAIAQSSFTQRGQRPQVTCPANVPQHEGVGFDCKAKVGEVSTRFVVVQTDDDGNVHYEAP
jgi:Domain of unknown function (DUF4333)